VAKGEICQWWQDKIKLHYPPPYLIKSCYYWGAEKDNWNIASGKKNNS
jgi:hypothetical protein